LLCIQDTTEFNLSSQAGRIKANTGLGKTSKEGILGFMMHSSVVIDAKRSGAIGYSYIKVWERLEDSLDRHQRNYKRLHIKEKESNKWIEASNESKKCCHQPKPLLLLQIGKAISMI
jgi:hypothetical protein